MTTIIEAIIILKDQLRCLLPDNCDKIYVTTQPFGILTSLL